MKRWPSACDPRTATYSEPGVTLRLSVPMPLSAGSVSASTRRSARRSASSERCRAKRHSSVQMVTIVPAVAVVPATGSVRTACPVPFTLARKPCWCTASTAARTPRPETSGTVDTGFAAVESGLRYGHDTRVTEATASTLGAGAGNCAAIAAVVPPSRARSMEM